VADQTCWKDTCVVEHEEIARAEMVCQSSKRRVLDLTGKPWKYQKSRLPSLSRRALSDQLVRQIEIEIAGP
jgi:hypothetical protein